MRVTGGTARGRALKVPPDTRPMTARMREALFVILGGVLGGVPGSTEGGVQGRSFLDLFAGSGLIAAEAASRGARPVTAVERDPRKRRTVQANLAAVGLSTMGGDASVIIAPAERFIAAAGRRGRRFCVVCLDPPYAYRHKQELLAALAAAAIVEAAGCVILHCPDRDPLDVRAVPFALADRRRYGQSALMLFRP